MYKFNEIKELHIELTTNCQLACPMCARNFHGGLDNPLIKIKSIDLTFFKKICPEHFIKQITSIIMCGNFGDPILNNDLILIIEYITKINPNIIIDLHTNGSARSISWWEQLAKAMPSCSHSVISAMAIFQFLFFVELSSLWRFRACKNLLRGLKPSLSRFMIFRRNCTFPPGETVCNGYETEQ